MIHPGAAHTAATTKRQIRQGQAFNFLYESQTDENIREMLFTLAETAPAELAGDDWNLVVSQCADEDNDLELSKQNHKWEGMTIMNTVGHSESTITDFARES